MKMTVTFRRDSVSESACACTMFCFVTVLLPTLPLALQGMVQAGVGQIVTLH